MDQIETYRAAHTKSYSGISASGNSRLHLGDTFHISSASTDDLDHDFVKSLGPGPSILLQLVDFAVRVTTWAGALADPTADIEDVIAEREVHELSKEYEAIDCILTRLPASDEDGFALAIGRELHHQMDTLLLQLPDLPWEMRECGQERVILRRGLQRVELHINWLARFLLDFRRARTTTPPPETRFGQQWLDVVLSRDDLLLVRRLAVVKVKQIVQIQKRLLESLSFEDMGQRKHEIKDAYRDTYRWALSNDSQGLKTWLKEGQGFYWITGKAGSGKSTLMRYLREHRDTQVLLEQWSGGHEIALLHFYFWYPGSSLQKSTFGLIRAIMHQLLGLSSDDGPNHLITVAWPQLFIDSRKQRSFYSWSEKELVDVFQTIAQHRYRSRTMRFCVFIDGLDEYHGNHVELLQMLGKLLERTDVKMCVSSRPWNAFRQAFEKTVPYLHLEDLTRSDIRTFVQGQISSAQLNLGMLSRSYEESVRDRRSSRRKARENALQKLEQTIVERAEGVFLWVFLVVRSVISGLNEGDSVSILQRRVEEFPKDLEDFFRSILLRVESVYRDQTYQCLKLACLHSEDAKAEELSSWVDFWLICDNAKGFGAETALELETQTLDDYDEADMQDELRRSLSASCKDLLYLPHPNYGRSSHYSVSSSVKVTWLHRTVYDFLSLQTMQDIVNANVPGLFGNGQHYPLFGLARGKILRDCQTAAEIGDTLGAAVSGDFNMLSEEYLAEVERALYYHHNALLSLMETDSLPTKFLGEAGAEVAAVLLAYGLIDFMDRILVAKTMGQNKPKVLLTVIGRHPLLSAHPRDLDVDLLDTISSKWPTEPGDLRDLFLDRWHYSLSNFNILELRRVWDITKRFLELRPPVLKYSDTHDVPINFLEASLPPDWLVRLYFETCPRGRCSCVVPKQAKWSRSQHLRREDRPAMAASKHQISS